MESTGRQLGIKSQVRLNAGDTLVLNATTGTNGGYGINSFGVTAVPDPVASALHCLSGLGLLIRRKR